MARVVFNAHLSAEVRVSPGAIFKDENRGLMVQDVPSARSRSGGILAEGSPQGRIGMGSEHHPGCWAHGLKRSHQNIYNIAGVLNLSAQFVQLQ